MTRRVRLVKNRVGPSHVNPRGQGLLSSALPMVLPLALPLVKQVLGLGAKKNRVRRPRTNAKGDGILDLVLPLAKTLGLGAKRRGTGTRIA